MSVAVVVCIALGVVVVVQGAALVTLAVINRRTRAALQKAREAALPRRPGPRTVTGRAIKTVMDTALRVREQGVGGLLAIPLEEFTRWANEDRAAIEQVTAADGTVTVLFSDIEGSTARNEELGDTEWVRVLDAHDTLVRTQVQRRGGHVVKSQGDGYMVVFAAPADAVACACAIQTALADGTYRRLRRAAIAVRIGIHVGTVVSREGDYFGRNVAMAARVAANAQGAEIVMSDETRAALPEGAFDLVEVGEVELKGLADRHLLWAVRWERR